MIMHTFASRGRAAVPGSDAFREDCVGVRVAVAGASGYAGGELLRLILGHPDLEIGPVTAGASAGTPVTDVHPHLPELARRTFDQADPGLLAAADLVFLALPNEESAALAASLPGHTAVVDLSASFRLADPDAWAAYYRTGHAGRGTSGAGRSASAPLATEVMGAVSAYQVGGTHRHTPEIEQVLAEVASGPDGQRAAAEAARPAVSFTPMLAPMPRGILATCTGRLAGAEPTTPALRAALAGAYTGEPFVHVLPEGRWPTTAATTGANAVHLQAAADPHAGRAVVVAALDNLGKGAAGQAVQAANLMLGLPET